MFEKELFEMQDEWYRGFALRLMPTVEPERVIGIRMPALRNFARQIRDTADAKAFLLNTPHRYFEQNNLHGFLIEFIRDYDECIRELDRFLPFIDNWATCDSISPKVFQKYPDRLISDIKRWLNSSDIYTTRFGLKTLMSFFLDENFKEEYLELAVKTPTDDYYLSMMTAWFFASALTKQYDFALPYLTERRLDRPTHNRTIQKALDSLRIAEDIKNYLKTLKY